MRKSSASRSLARISNCCPRSPSVYSTSGRRAATRARRAFRPVRIDQADFAGRVVVGIQDDELIALGLPDIQEKTGVGLFVNQLRFAPEAAAVNPAGPRIVVAHGIEDGPAVIGPDDTARRPFDPVRKVGAGLGIAKGEPVVFGTGKIDGIGNEPVVRAVGASGDAAVRLALRQAVAVEQDSLFAFAVLAAETRVLAAGYKPGVVGKRTVGSRRSRIVFLDSGAHLLRQNAPAGHAMAPSPPGRGSFSASR